MQESDLRNYKIILASGSARRKEIFENHGLNPVVMPMDVDETLADGIAPQDAVMYLALKKGLAAEQALTGEQRSSTLTDEQHALIISADTIVYAKDVTTGEWTIMGKPKDEEDAWRMLRSIASGKHKVMTGVAMINCCVNTESESDFTPIRRVFFDSTDVFVKPMSDDEIREYVESGEPFGKAGGYAIQMEFGKYIDHIEGDYWNVVGFPFDHLEREMNLYCK